MRSFSKPFYPTVWCAILLTVMLQAHVTLGPEAKRFHVWNSSRYGFDACRYDPMECVPRAKPRKTDARVTGFFFTKMWSVSYFCGCCIWADNDSSFAPSYVAYTRGLTLRQNGSPNSHCLSSRLCCVDITYVRTCVMFPLPPSLESSEQCLEILWACEGLHWLGLCHGRCLPRGIS